MRPIGSVPRLLWFAGCLALAGGGTALAQSFCNNPFPRCDPTELGSPCYRPYKPDERCEPKPCDKCRKSPCFVGTGSYMTETTDLVLPTPGFPLVASRTYDSTLAIDGPLGYGWTTSLAPRLYFATYLLALPDTVRRRAYLKMPDGARYEFNETTTGTFTPPLGRYDTLVRNPDDSFDLTIQRSSSVFHFGPGGGLQWMRDDYGNRVDYTYDANGRVERVADASGSGRYIDVVWGANGRISALVDSSGRQVLYGYDLNGMLVRVTDPMLREASYGYTQGKYVPLLTAARDPWNRVLTTVVYDVKDRVTSYSENGETYSYTYLYQNDPTKTSKSDSLGNTWVFTHGEGGLVTGEVAPGGNQRATRYAADGSIEQTTDEMGVVTSYVYDGTRRVIFILRDDHGPNAVTFTYEYDPAFPNHVTAITAKDPNTNNQNDPDWQSWRYEYYQAGSPTPGALHRVKRLRADGVTLDLMATYTYNSRGQVLTSADAGGGVTEYTYDAQGNLDSVTAPSNNDAGTRPVTHYTYDGLGRVVAVTDAVGAVTTYAYDALGRPLSAIPPRPSPASPLDFTTTIVYDRFDSAAGLLWSATTDPNGIVTSQGTDAFGRMIASVDGLGATTTYGYSRGLLSSITDAHGYTTQYTYNALRQLSATIFPDGAQETYSYWPDGQLATKRDRKLQTLTYAYDTLKRLNRKTYPDATYVQFSYQGQKLTRVDDSYNEPDEVHTVAYDDAYRVIANTQADRGTIEYTYTADDEVASYTVVGGPTTTYSYYPDRSVNTIEWTPVTGEFKYRYNPRGQYESVTFPNGQQRLYSYDDQGRLLQLANVHPTAGNLATYGYGYDIDHTTGLPARKGQRTSMVADVPSQGFVNALTKYGYDVAYQLTKAEYPPGPPFNGEVHEWTYDLIGNRLTNTVNGLTQAYAYQKLGTNPRNWIRLLSDGVNSYEYDANGSVAAIDAAVNTTSLTYSVEGDPTRMQSGGQTAATRRDPTGRAVDDFAVAGLQKVWSERQNGLGRLRDPQTGDLLASSEGASVVFADVDGLKNVTLALDSALNQAATAVFDVWGTLRAGTELAAGGFAGEPSGTTAIRLLGFRYYSSALGRFLSEEPYARYNRGIQGGVLYPYALNSPAMFVDPHGLEPTCTDYSQPPYLVLDDALFDETRWVQIESSFQSIPLPVVRVPQPQAINAPTVVGAPSARNRPANVKPPYGSGDFNATDLFTIHICRWQKTFSWTYYWSWKTVVFTVCEDRCQLASTSTLTVLNSPAGSTSDRRQIDLYTRGWAVLGVILFECRNPNQ